MTTEHHLIHGEQTGVRLLGQVCGENDRALNMASTNKTNDNQGDVGWSSETT